MKESWEVNDDVRCILALLVYFAREGRHVSFDLRDLSEFSCLNNQTAVLKILEGLRRNGDISYIAPPKRGGEYKITLLRRIGIDEKWRVHLIESPAVH